MSVTRIINAPAHEIFALLTDPAKHPEIDGSGTVRAYRGTRPHRLELGSRFGMDMRIGVPYRVVNTVVEFEAGQRIAWRHYNGYRWRWELRDLGDGRTEVTEIFDWTTGRLPTLIELFGFPARSRANMEATLARLARRFDDRSG